MRIVFVCTGNTCRSPMAAGLARQILGPEIFVESAGLAAWAGDSASPQAIAVLKEHDIDLSSHRARPVNSQTLAEADWIIPMTKAHELQLKGAFPEYSSKIKRLGDWGSQDKSLDVSDPWGGSVEVYRQCAEEIEAIIFEIKKALAI